MRKKRILITDLPLHELDIKFGWVIKEWNGKQYFAGASTDWCFYPLDLIRKLRIKERKKVK